MTDKTKIALYDVEIVEHANGTALFLVALIDGNFVIQVKAYAIADYVQTQAKRKIVSCPIASQEEKDFEIRKRERT